MNYKLFSRIVLVTFVIVSVMFLGLSSNLKAVSRLINAKDTLSRIGMSSSSSISGYTQSTQAITDDFVIVTDVNNIICMDTDGTPSFNATCTGEGNVKANLITHGGLVSGAHYTGDQIAAAIAKALAAVDGIDVNDSYTVTYSETNDRFSIRADGGNILNPALGFVAYTDPADSAAATLGYTENKIAIRTTVAVSDSAVAFNVIAGINNSFSIIVNGDPTSGSTSVTVTSGIYTAPILASQLQTNINNATPTYDVAASYSNDKFRISSSITGINSTIKIIEGANDFLRTVRMNGDIPIGGIEAPGAISANHTIVFTTFIDVPAGGNIHLTFDSDFSFPSDLNYQDMDLIDDGIDLPLDSTPSGATWGVGVVTADRIITLTSGNGVIEAGSIIAIKIGTHAIYDGEIGTKQITNPFSLGLKQIFIEIRNSSNAVLADTKIGVYIAPTDSVILKAAIDETLSFGIYGGNMIDFGTLIPNVYHKLGGAQPAYGHIDLTGVTVNSSIDQQIVTVRSIDYEMSNDGTIEPTSEARVDIVDGDGNYLSTAQVTINLYKAINNYDGDWVRARVSALSDTVVYLIANRAGATGNDYDLSTNVTGATVSGADFDDGFSGYNNRSNNINYNSGADAGNSQTGTYIFVSTNTDEGYVLTVENTDTNGANDSADGLSNGTAEIEEWGAGTYGYGILASARSTVYGDGTNYTVGAGFRSTGNLPKALSTTLQTLASYSSKTVGDNIAIEYNVRIDAHQQPGYYKDTATYIITLIF